MNRNALTKTLLFVVAASTYLALFNSIKITKSIKKLVLGELLDTKSYSSLDVMPSSDSTADAIDELIAKSKMNTSASVRVLFDLLKNKNIEASPASDNAAIINATDKETEAKERCARYNFEYNATLTGGKPRRIFWGSLIADDSWHAIGGHAIEAYGLYHTIAFIESNTTQSLTRRETRFVDGNNPTEEKALNRKVLQSGIFGPKTNVEFDYFIGNWKDNVKYKRSIQHLTWEHMQREGITKIWKYYGMTPEDIGIVSDVDEVFSRDFLLAAQTCDIPQFRPGQDCKTPKVVASTLAFESSLECIRGLRWFHPDMIIGECIEGISDIPGDADVVREFRNSGCRKEGYGKKQDDFKKHPLNETDWEKYPLWSPADYRCVEGGNMHGENRQGDEGPRTTHNAFHFHNFFENGEVLRNKYKTYGHPLENAFEAPLGALKVGDLNVVLKCVLDRDNDFMPYPLERLGDIFGRLPELGKSEEYRRVRHEELKKILEEDELKYGIYVSPEEEEEERGRGNA